ncbi:MAG: hypothetical protein U5K75_08895 [Ahrensia sp.]|nr:hypothetical protein [Ahrensia sp.]
MRADEAILRYSGSSSSPAPQELNNLAGDLRALEELARDSDDRNGRTFSAIHDTLLKVVDHLAGLEETIRVSPVRAAMVSAPEKTRLVVPEAPHVAPHEEFDKRYDASYADPADYQPIEQRPKLNPSQAAAAAARAALLKLIQMMRTILHPRLLMFGQKSRKQSLY